MKCASFLSGLLLFLFATATAQSPTENVCTEHYCSYSGADLVNIRTIHPFKSEEEARAVMNDVVKVVGLVPNFVVQAADVPNAAAWINESRRYILYNPTFIQSVRVSTRTDWAAISILAHEIGHHLNGHTLTREGSRPNTELEADEFSGFALRKMGASLDEAQAAMRLLASEQGSLTHPPRNQRLSAIQRGWFRADALLVEANPPIVDNGPSVPPVTQKPSRPVSNPASPAPVPAFAQWRVSMVSNPNSQYYITKSKSFVLVKNGKVYDLGAFKPTDNAEFPYMIVMKNSPNLIISREGELISQGGNSVGYLEKE
jgi:hypothetical protein